MSKRTITGKRGVWLSQDQGPEALEGTAEDVLGRLFLLNGDADDEFWLSSGYVYVGEADVTLQLADTNTLVQNKVDALRAHQKRVIADAQLMSTQIESQIQKLLAIECAPEVA